MTPPPNTTQLDAEVLLASTGLLQPPDATSIAAAQILLEDLKRQIVATLDKENQTAVRVNDLTTRYHEKLAQTPAYETMTAQLAETHGLAFAAAYQEAHQRARQLLLDRWPENTLDTIFGARIYPGDPEAVAQWLLEGDTVENQRVAKDFAAAALLPECMEVFVTAYPALYREVLAALNEELAQRVETEWSPPPWLESTIATFKGIEDPAIPPAPPPAPPPPAGAKLATDRLETASEKVAG